MATWEEVLRQRVVEQKAADQEAQRQAYGQAVRGIAAGDSSGLARKAIQDAAAANWYRTQAGGNALADFAARADANWRQYSPGLEGASVLALGRQKEGLDFQRLMNTKEDEARALRDYMAALGDMPQVGTGGGGGGGGRRGGGGGEPAAAAPAARPPSTISSTLSDLLGAIRGGGTPAPRRRPPTPSLPRATRPSSTRPSRVATRYS